VEGVRGHLLEGELLLVVGEAVLWFLHHGHLVIEEVVDH